jgi:3-phosphoshikimate 1-carboxyvinyltransferase
MDAEIRPGSRLRGVARVPGDKSIAHRWLLLAATGEGRSRIVGPPPSLDVRSTAACLAEVAPKPRASLHVFASNAGSAVEGGRSTWNDEGLDAPPAVLEVEGEGRARLVEPRGDLDCGNSGTSMRLLAGVLAAAPFTSILTGDDSLSRRPMERVARPLREMGAGVRTDDGHAPVRITGGDLHGITFAPEVPSAQVKSAVLLAGLAAAGVTAVREPAPTRDHTERALEALGAPIERSDHEIRLRAYEHGAFDGTVPGDPSSAAFLIAAAALTGSSLTIEDVGLNPTRLHYLDVMARMGITTETDVARHEVGEPVGTITVRPTSEVRPVRIEPEELPLVIDEVPVLAALAAHASGESWFLGAGELRVKESDRLAALVDAIGALGGMAADEGDDLVIAGGGLAGGSADPRRDHRIAMALVVAALAAEAPVRVRGVEAAVVSFPGFVETLRSIGAAVEVR